MKVLVLSGNEKEARERVKEKYNDVEFVNDTYVESYYHRSNNHALLGFAYCIMFATFADIVVFCDGCDDLIDEFKDIFEKYGVKYEYL